MEKILLIPSNTTESIDEFYFLKNNANYVMGASSISLDSSSYIYDAYFKIPWITDSNFLMDIKNIVDKESVDKIVCTHVGIFNRIKTMFSADLLCEVESRDLYGIKMQGIECRALQHFESIQSEVENITYVEFKSLFCQFLKIPGNCSEEKFSALVSVGENSPQGDFIEIGSFYGKSALILGWMAKRKGCKLLCIDPWNKNEIKQEEAHEFIVHKSNGRINDIVKDAFVSNLYLTLKGTINYFQGYSDDVFYHYESGCEVISEDFGVTNYLGYISCLHVDGNHDYQYAKSDIVRWSKYLLSGGWLIVDDYKWCYGDGPKIAADEYFIENIKNIDVCFFCGGALFIKMK